ncbi:MAG TPA: ATP-binding protein [Reyranella sp.]|nr:ATP-binding protein [Reyranella sp.]
MTASYRTARHRLAGSAALALGIPGLISISLTGLLAVICLADALFRKEDTAMALAGGALAGAALATVVLLCRAVLRLNTTCVQLQATIDALPAGIVVYDGSERLIQFNRAAADLVPVLRSNDVVGKTFAELAARSAEGDKARYVDAAPADAWIDRFRRREPRILTTIEGRRVSWSEVPGPDGGTIGLRVDVTELKEMEIAARRANADYQRLLNSLSDTVFRVHTRAGLIDFMSAAALDLLGHEVLDIRGRPYLDFVVPEDHERIRDALRDAAKESGVTRLMQYRMIHRNGEIRHVEVRFSRLSDEDGVDIVSGVIRDVSDRVALELRRHEAEEALQQSERLALLGEMAGAVVHEIAQPLSVIDFTRFLVAEEAADENVPLDHSYVTREMTRIGEQLGRANRIVGDLRGFVRGSASDEVMEIDIADAIRDAVDMTHHSMTLAGAGLEVSLPPGLPRITARSGTLDQVLINLINNARDAGAKHVAIEARAVDGDEGRKVCLTVCDDGPGVREDVLPKLFTQLVTTKSKGKGTGLGLRICLRIVEGMGGSISAGNLPAGGARFEIILPAG